MPFGCTAPADAPEGSFPGAPRSSEPAVGDVVETVGGVVGIVMAVVGPFLKIALEDGQEVEVPRAETAVVPPPAAPAAPAPATDWMPIMFGGGLLLVVLIMAMRR